MSRPKSDTRMVAFRLTPEDLARLDAYARALGLVIEGGKYQGQPDRSAAIRDAIRGLDPDAITRR